MLILTFDNNFLFFKIYIKLLQIDFLFLWSLFVCVGYLKFKLINLLTEAHKRLNGRRLKLRSVEISLGITKNDFIE